MRTESCKKAATGDKEIDGHGKGHVPLPRKKCDGSKRDLVVVWDWELRSYVP